MSAYLIYSSLILQVICFGKLVTKPAVHVAGFSVTLQFRTLLSTRENQSRVSLIVPTQNNETNQLHCLRINCNTMLSTMLRRKLVCVLILGLLPGLSFAAISCMDMNGRPVDWFIVYKLPTIAENRNPSIQNGTAFMYMDVNRQNFRLSDVSLNNEKQAVGYTLEQIYRNYRRQNIGYGMYNDQHPDGKVVSNRGHTKGVLALDSSTGFWLVHSVPRFPNPNYSWPENARRNGQSFLCLTLKYQQFEEIGKLLLYNWPSTYDSWIPSFIKLPSLVAALGGKHTKDQVTTLSLTTKNGQRFLSFAKSSTFNKDLYSDLVAPALESDLFTETWQNGGGKLPSSCNMEYHVMNVQHVSINGVAFPETKDHSKWAVTTDVNKKWTCIGDINRQEGQKKRGGGTVCTTLPEVWAAFRSAIKQSEDCSTNASMAILSTNQSDFVG